MKKTIAVLAAAFVLLFALTGCSDTRYSGDSMTADRSYTADAAGRTNEAGDNGITTGSNATATNGTDKKRTDAVVTNPDTTADREERRTVTGTVQDGSSAAARDVERAVDRAGDVVDDAAYGAADIVNGATDVITGKDQRRAAASTVR